MLLALRYVGVWEHERGLASRLGTWTWSLPALMGAWFLWAGTVQELPRGGKVK